MLLGGFVPRAYRPQATFGAMAGDSFADIHGDLTGTRRTEA